MVVVNNADRKGGHVLPMPDGHRHGVDHGLTFHLEHKLRTVLWGWVGEPITDDEVVFQHVYTERRVYPLDLYLREMAPERAYYAAVDYGNAVKDLAAANIFPGDLFPKNFGVTRHGTG